MVVANKKPRSFKSLAAENDQGLRNIHVVGGHQQHAERIARAGLLKQRSKDQEQFLFALSENQAFPLPDRDYFEYLAKRMSACGHYMLFRDYYTIEQVKLVSVRTCQIHLLCPFCAHNRAAKQVKAYSERLAVILASKPRLKPVFITLTVKNGVDLAERMQHLQNSVKTLLDRRRDSLKKGRGYVEFSKIKGAVFSYEVTFNEVTREWHPHIHMFALVNDWINRDVLLSEWFDVTGDSYVVDVRRVRKVDGGYGEAFCEVFKYALKFSDMGLGTTLEAFLSLRMRRLQGSIGLFRGVSVPDSAVDDVVGVEDLPYMEMLYKFANKQGYSLVATKKIDSHAGGWGDMQPLRVSPLPSCVSVTV